jgi:hypothetical protein
MLAGLGQIHIDTDVILSDVGREEPFAVYAVTKTFAWGGLYGASTRITDGRAWLRGGGGAGRAGRAGRVVIRTRMRIPALSRIRPRLCGSA